MYTKPRKATRAEKSSGVNRGFLLKWPEEIADGVEVAAHVELSGVRYIGGSGRDVATAAGRRVGVDLGLGPDLYT